MYEYTLTKNTSEHGLVAYYNFNQTSRDMTGNGQDGILMYKETYVLSTPLGLQHPNAESTESTLLQIYPNPFTQSTTFRYTLSEDAEVEVQIYNAIGQLVSQPENRWQPAGLHVFTYTPQNLPSGVYFCRLITEQGDVKTDHSTKMIFIK